MTGGTAEGSTVARETKMDETDLPLGGMQHCFLISYNQELIQNAGYIIFINGKISRSSRYIFLNDYVIPTWSLREA